MSQPQEQERRRVQNVEREIVLRLTPLMSREFGLMPAETSATLSQERLRVRLRDALSPMARMIAHLPEGRQVLPGVYKLLNDANEAQTHPLVARIVGRPVWRSAVEVDVTSGDVWVTFDLAPRDTL